MYIVYNYYKSWNKKLYFKNGFSNNCTKFTFTICVETRKFTFKMFTLKELITNLYPINGQRQNHFVQNRNKIKCHLHLKIADSSINKREL